jgi:two-component system sensor histidine kinase UhpB
MPLRLRLIVLVGLVLLVSLACGSALVCWRAARSVQTELRAALDVGAKSIRAGFDDLAVADDPSGELRRLVATFNGNRHVRAELFDAQGQPVITSKLFAPTQAVPGWFLRLIRGRPPSIVLPVPQVVDHGSVIDLQTDPTNEIGEVWAASRDAVMVLAGFAALSTLIISSVIGRALRSLEVLSAALERISEGDHPGALPVRGPPELTRLVKSFNLMTERLAIAATQNDRLNERLLTLQAEERAALARDLHDEIGPLLFAVDMTAAAVERVADSGHPAAIAAHARSIHDAVGRMQRSVRTILERLRPLQGAGLETAIRRLAAFWQSRRPEITVIVTFSIEEDQVDDDLKDTIYRVVQESVSNSIRHGEPTRIEIEVVHGMDGCIRVRVTDDGNGMPAGTGGRQSTRLGLVGMRERVTAMAGSLSILHGDNERGLSLVVTLPAPEPHATQDQRATSENSPG